MSPLPQPFFWEIHYYTYLGLRKLWHSGKLQGRELARDGALLPESSLIDFGMPRSNCSSRRNSPGMPNYPRLMRSPAPPLGSRGPQWIEVAPTSYLDLVVTSFRSQWSCLQVTILWVYMRKKCCFHLMTSAVDGDPRRKRRLLSTFNARLLRGVDIGCLALWLLSAWQSYSPLISSI